MLGLVTAVTAAVRCRRDVADRSCTTFISNQLLLNYDTPPSEHVQHQLKRQITRVRPPPLRRRDSAHM